MFFNYSGLLVILINLVPALFIYQTNNSDSEDQPIVLTYFKVEYNDFGIKSEQLIEEVHDCSKLKVEFDAFNRHFVLQLLCDNKLFTPDSKLNVIEENGLSQSMLRSSNISVYTGHLQGDVNSYAIATIHNNSFESILHTVNGSYIIEPNQTENETIIYKYGYIKLDSTVNNITQLKKLKAEEDLKKKQIELSQSIKRVNQFQNKTTKRTHWRRSFPDSQTCSLHLIADHTFVDAFNGNMKSALAEMIHHAIVADKIFRSTDFNGDGIGDNIGFSIADVTIYMESSPNYPFAGVYINADDYLAAFIALDFSSYCLGFGFTNRDFSDGVLGLAWLGFSGEFSPPGGICESRLIYEDTEISLNTGIMTLNNYGKKQPREVTTLTMVHELAHSFGSSHDPDTLQCSPGGTLGDFIMSSLATDGNQAHNSQFSPCSKEAIAPVIVTKGTCLISSDKGWCGNGLVEDEEECDCGGVLQCIGIDSCCTPPGGVGNDSGCTIHRDLGYVCSPLVSPCCTNECQIVPAVSNVICQPHSECKLPSRCSGISSKCPNSDMLANGSSCDQGTKRCQGGQCVISICMDLGLQECTCEDKIEDKCKICCQDVGGCIPAATLGLFHQNGELLLKPAGRVCNNYEGYCDTLGACIMVDSDSALNRLKELFTNQGALSFLQWCIVNWYYGFVLILSMCILVLLIRILACRPRRPVRDQICEIPLEKLNTETNHEPLQDDADFQSLILELFPSLEKAVLMEVIDSNKCLCNTIQELIKLKQPLNKSKNNL